MHTQSVRRGLRVQAKLEISQPQDADELEADRTAELVMRMPDRESKGSDSIYFAFVHYGECVGFINQVIDASYSNWGKS